MRLYALGLVAYKADEEAEGVGHVLTHTAGVVLAETQESAEEMAEEELESAFPKDEGWVERSIFVSEVDKGVVVSMLLGSVQDITSELFFTPPREKMS